MPLPPRSTCPIARALDLVGDRWSLLILRDVMFKGFRNFRQFRRAGEGISTSILALRLEALVEAHVLCEQPDPRDGRKVHYTVGSRGRELAPVMLELIDFGVRSLGGIAPPRTIHLIRTDRATLLKRLRGRWIHPLPGERLLYGSESNFALSRVFAGNFATSGARTAFAESRIPIAMKASAVRLALRVTHRGIVSIATARVAASAPA